MGCEESTNNGQYGAPTGGGGGASKAQKTYQNMMEELNQICINSRPVTTSHMLEVGFSQMRKISDNTTYINTIIIKCINPSIILNILKWHLKESGKTAQQMDYCEYESYTSPVTNTTVYLLETKNIIRDISDDSYNSKSFLKHSLINYILSSTEYRLVNTNISDVFFEYKSNMNRNNYQNNVELVVQKQNYQRPQETYSYN